MSEESSSIANWIVSGQYKQYEDTDIWYFLYDTYSLELPAARCSYQ